MRQISSVLILTFFWIPDLLKKCGALSPPARGFCATGPPGEHLKAEHERLNTLESQDDLGVNYESREVVSPIEIVTWFHILLSSEDDVDTVSDNMIANQVDFSYFIWLRPPPPNYLARESNGYM